MKPPNWDALKFEELALESENGLIAMALDLYSNFVIDNRGDSNLILKLKTLSNKYRNMV